MMQPAAIEIILHWVTVLLYILGSLTNTVVVIFSRQQLARLTSALMYAGLSIHSVALAYRWYLAGHGPYLSKYEILSSGAWMTLAIFLFARRRYAALIQTGLVVFPGVFLLNAVAIFCNPQIHQVPPSLRSIWLVFHVSFYKIALGTIIVGLAASVLVVLNKRSALGWLKKMPDPEILDVLAFRFAGFGFLFWGVAMIAGSIWAFESWGRFWGWDPIETWSLLTWIVFGLYLHMRRFYSWGGEKAAWLYSVCFLCSIFSLFFVSLLEGSIHSAYFQ